MKPELDIYYLISVDSYRPKASYPQKPSRPTLQPADTTIDQARKHVERLIKYERKLKTYDQMMENYRKERAEKDAAFRIDALEYCGLTGHPKADKAFALAQEDGHSSGLGDVVGNLCDLADLLLGD